MNETKEIPPLAFDVEGSGFDEGGLRREVDEPIAQDEVKNGNE